MMFCKISNTNTYKKVYFLESSDILKHSRVAVRLSYAVLTQEMLLIDNSMNALSKM